LPPAGLLLPLFHGLIKHEDVSRVGQFESSNLQIIRPDEIEYFS
jgi:hypothetical protein